MGIGEIRIVAFDYEPEGWLFCDGRELDIAAQRPLFDAIGTTYGGDGKTKFRLPDLRDRTPVHRGNGRALGATGSIKMDRNERPKPGVTNAALNLSFIIATIDPMPEPFYGEIRIFAGESTGAGFVPCLGQTISIRSNTALFSLLNHNFSEAFNGQAFQLPDLRGRIPIHSPAARGQQRGAGEFESADANRTHVVMQYCLCVERGIFPSRQI